MRGGVVYGAGPADSPGAGPVDHAGESVGDAAGGSGADGGGVAEELGCDWHTVSKEVNRWGEALLEADRDRVGIVEALGLDETLFLRQGPWRRRMWITAAVDVRNRRLIDVFPGIRR